MGTLKDRTITLKDSPMLVRFEPSLKERLIDRAKREGMSAAAVVRMSVRAFLDLPKKK